MRDKAKPRFATATWVPLFADQTWELDEFPRVGNQEEYFGATAVLIDDDVENAEEAFEWSAFRSRHRPEVDDENYFPAFELHSWPKDLHGTYLVMRNTFQTGDCEQLVFNSDLILALGLLKDGESWLYPTEDYAEVIRATQDSDGRTSLVEMRSEYLKDYLCARRQNLVIVTYRSRYRITDKSPTFDMPPPQIQSGKYWEGGVSELDAEGNRYGQTMSSMIVGRTDVDPDDDAPVLNFSLNEETWSRSETRVAGGEKRFRVASEMWRNELVPGGKRSVRVKGDEEVSTVTFITDTDGATTTAPDLVGPDSRWLWFKPQLLQSINQKRGVGIRWITQNTGLIYLAGDSIHFGMNDGHLVNIYAKDVAELSVFWQRSFVSFNVAPEDRVCRELLAAQMECRPASTVAPEVSLQQSIELLQEAFYAKFSSELFSSHDSSEALWHTIHRFNSCTGQEFFRLCKDMTRLLIERINTGVLKSVTASCAKKLGTLKRLEHLAAANHPDARTLLSPWHGIYALRIADAHLTSSSVEEAMIALECGVESHPVDNAKNAIATMAKAAAALAAAL